MAARCAAPVDIPERVFLVVHSGHRAGLFHIQFEPGEGLCGQQRGGIGHHGQRGCARPGSLAIYGPPKHDSRKWDNNHQPFRRVPIRTKSVDVNGG